MASLQRYRAKRDFDRTPEPRGAEFEGDIPTGEYGGGHVDLWDQGTWVPEEAPVPAYRRGKIKFELKGERLKGRWALVRMGNAQTRKKDLWLLMKRIDADDAGA